MVRFQVVTNKLGSWQSLQSTSGIRDIDHRQFRCGAWLTTCRTRCDRTAAVAHDTPCRSSMPGAELPFFPLQQTPTKPSVSIASIDIALRLIADHDRAPRVSGRKLSGALPFPNPIDRSPRVRLRLPNSIDRSPLVRLERQTAFWRGKSPAAPGSAVTLPGNSDPAGERGKGRARARARGKRFWGSGNGRAGRCSRTAAACVGAAARDVRRADASAPPLLRRVTLVCRFSALALPRPRDAGLSLRRGWPCFGRVSLSLQRADAASAA